MEAPPSTVDGHHRSTHRRSRSGLWYPGRMYVSGRVDIFDMVDIDLFTVVALNMMVLKLGYTGKYEPMFYNYLKPLTSLDEGLYALACEEDVRCLGTLVRSFKLIEVYIEHGVTALDSYLRAPRFRATLKEITDEPGSIAANRTENMLLLTWHESSETTKKPICASITPRCMPDCILTPHTNESVITYTQLSGVQGVDTQSHVLPIIQSQFSDINLSFISQQATTNQAIDDVIRQLSFDETELDGEASFADVTGSGVDSSGLSHDESFGVDDLDLNLNKPVNLNVSQVETQSKLPVSEEPDVGRTQEPILSEVSTQEPIVGEEFSVEDVVLEDYVSSREDAEQGIDTAYEIEYDVQSSEDAGTNDDDDDDVDDDFVVDEENDILEPDVDVHLFGISMDLPFDNIVVTNLVSDDVLEGEDVDVINADGFDSDLGNDVEKKLQEEKKFTTPKEAKDRVYMHSIKRRRNLKLYKNDDVGIRARCDEKVHVFTMSQGTGPTGPNRRMEAGPSESNGPTTRSKKRKNTDKFTQNWVVRTHNDTHTCLQSREIKHCTYKFLSEKIFEQVRANPDIPVKAVQDQLQCELEVQISMSKAFRAKAKAEREIRGDHVLQYSMLRDYVVELQLQTLIPLSRLRDLLDLDGDFMKGPFLNQILCLGDDIDLHPNSNFTFISDRQKGIIPAINFVYLRILKSVCLELKTRRPKGTGWLNKYSRTLARTYFPGRAKSDLLLKNIYEVFNGKIVRGRDKPVIDNR
ncbi:hypothetical protein Tco_1482457 [Tanacetum coccineum]